MAASRETPSQQQFLMSNISAVTFQPERGSIQASTATTGSSNQSLIHFDNANANSALHGTASTPANTQPNKVSIPVTLLQSLLEFKRLSTRMFLDPELHITQPFANYKEHFELALAKFGDEKKKFVAESPNNVKYDRMLIDPRLTKCNGVNCRIERSPGFRRIQPPTATTTTAIPLENEAESVTGSNSSSRASPTSENEWTRQQRTCQQFVRDFCRESHSRDCQCWKKFQMSLSSNVCSSHTTTAQPNSTASSSSNTVIQMPQPSTLNRNPALGTSNIALNNTAPVNRIKEETVEGIFPLKRPAYSPGRKDNPKQGSSSKRAAK
ncbi:hypothetical protein TYRP_001800 [Tyrophagus putrescentiae]|nr:hypothetical protein TYRP_001800 [Tyrophagus putrescentiae]